MTINVNPVNDAPTADPISETRVKTADDLRIDLIVDANASDIDENDTLSVINDGDESDDEPVVEFSRSGTTRVKVGVAEGVYTLDGGNRGAVELNPGRTYVFDWSEHDNHPLRFSETQDGTHGGGREYTNGVTVDADAGTTTIVVADGMPALYAYCENHSDMGFEAAIADYAVPEEAYSLEGGILTVSPRVFSDLASDNSVVIEVTYNIADGDVADETTNSIENTATVTITGLNTRPQIIDNYNDGDEANDLPNVADVTTDEDTAYTFTLNDFNYVDQDNDPLSSVLIVELPRDGQLTLNGEPVEGPQRITRSDIESGLLVYTPPENENGEEYTRFTYQVSDGSVDSEVGTMTINVNPVNDAPTSENRFIPIDGTTPVAFEVSDFAFSDIDGDTLHHISILTLPERGVLYIVPADTLVAAGASRSFAIQVEGVQLDEAWALRPQNDLEPATIELDSIDRLVYVADEKTSSLNYDSFTFTVNDGSDIAPRALDSEEPNTITFGQLAAADRTFVIQEDQILDTTDTELGLAMSGDDLAGFDNIEFDILSRPSKGSLEFLTDGNFIFKPPANFFDVDRENPVNQFEYSVIAAGLTSEPGTIKIIVEPQNDAPRVEDKIRNQLRFPDVEITPIRILPEMLFSDVDRYDPNEDGFDNFVDKPEPSGDPFGSSFDEIPEFGQLSFEVEGLPEGLYFDEGLIQGSTSESGRHPIVIKATDGGDLSSSTSFILNIEIPVVEPTIDKEPAKLPEVKIEKPTEEIAKLNDHDLPPLLRVNTGPTARAESNGSDAFEPTVSRQRVEPIEDNADLGDDSWMNTKVSTNQDISGNIRIIDLKVENKEIAVQITDEAVDRAERFKGEMADGSSLPTWIKVDPSTGLTTAEPPAGADAVEIRVVAEDGAGNARAIDLVLDPSAITQAENSSPTIADLNDQASITAESTPPAGSVNLEAVTEGRAQQDEVVITGGTFENKPNDSEIPIIPEALERQSEQNTPAGSAETADATQLENSQDIVPQGPEDPTEVAEDTKVPAIDFDNAPAVEAKPPIAERDISLSDVAVDVLSDGRVKFTDGLLASGEGTIKLTRMVTDVSTVKIEITDDAKETSTRYEVRQKDGSAAPDWVLVDSATGELSISAPDGMSNIELTLVAIDGGEQRSIELELDLDEMREQNDDGVEQLPEENLETDELQSSFIPLEAQIASVLAENSYGSELQISLNERG